MSWKKATTTEQGLIPETGTPTGKYLKDDLTWNAIAGGGDMTKAVYDSDENGVIEAAQLNLSSKSDTGHNHTGTYEPIKGADDNYVTDAEKTALHSANADTDLDATFEASLKNTDNHTSGTTNKVYTATEQTKLAGIATGAQVNADITKAEIEAKLTGAITSHSHAGGGGMTLLKKTANQTINAGAATFVDITDLTFPVVAGVDYAFHFYITFRSAAATTGWKSGVNHPGGTLDFWAKSAVIANGAAGVATHTERHNVAVNDMTLLTSTVTNNVDLSIIIEGRYMCSVTGTFAARFANELATNTDLVVQKGSWGWYF